MIWRGVSTAPALVWLFVYFTLRERGFSKELEDTFFFQHTFSLVRPPLSPPRGLELRHHYRIGFDIYGPDSAVDGTFFPYGFGKASFFRTRP